MIHFVGVYDINKDIVYQIIHAERNCDELNFCPSKLLVFRYWTTNPIAVA